MALDRPIAANRLRRDRALVAYQPPRTADQDLVRNGRYAVFQMAAAMLPRAIFVGIFDQIIGLRDPPTTTVST